MRNGCAIGCLIYSDPRDDGYAQGAVYPNGPWRPKDGAQRGSIMDMPTAPGDPLTIGVGATKDAKRIDRKDAATVMKIPVLPISYADAQPLLAAMTGPVAAASIIQSTIASTGTRGTATHRSCTGVRSRRRSARW